MRRSLAAGSAAITTACSGISTFGRHIADQCHGAALAHAADRPSAIGSFAPTHSMTTSAPASSVRDGRTACPLIERSVAPDRAPFAAATSSGSIDDHVAAPCRAQRLDRQDADHPAADHHRRYRPAVTGVRLTAWTATERPRSAPPARSSAYPAGGTTIRRGTDDIFGKRAVAPVLAGGDAQHLAVVAEIDVSARTEDALPAVDRRIEGDAIARFEIAYVGAGCSTTPAASCPITSGGIRRPVDPSKP